MPDLAAQITSKFYLPKGLLASAFMLTCSGALVNSQAGDKFGVF